MALGTMTRNAANSGDSHTPTFFDLISFAGDDSYPTGGSAIDALFQAATGVKAPRDLIAIMPGDCGGYVPVYDHANGKLKVYYADYDAVADGALIEVPNTTDLSGVTFNIMVVSK